jgi:hypothetical protein
MSPGSFTLMSLAVARVILIAVFAAWSGEAFVAEAEWNAQD